jgi:hypothetical protein
MRSLFVLPSLMIAAAAALAPTAAADPDTSSNSTSNLPSCTSVGGNEMGGGATECATPGNVQLNASPPEPTYPYPWDDEFYGPALIIGGDEGGYHGGGGGRR